MPKVMSCSWILLQVFHLARRAAMQFGLARNELRSVDRAFGSACNAAYRRVEKFDQAKLDFIDRQRLARQRVEVANGIGGQLGLVAGDRKPLVAAADHHVEPGFDLPDVLVQRTAQVGEQGVVDRREGALDRLRLGGGLSFRG